MVMVKHRFSLSQDTKDTLRSMSPNFGFNGFGEVTYYRTYSRLMENGNQENWVDTVIRVVEGIFSIRKSHYLKNGLGFKDDDIQDYARDFSIAMFKMEWLPSGRGLWAMGTDYVYERGSMALNNCAAVDTTDLVGAVNFMCDSLMCGVGCGFNTEFKGDCKGADKSNPVAFVVADSREGWVDSVTALVSAYVNGERLPVFDYSLIRPYGAPIKGFGGTASGFAPLKILLDDLVICFDNYLDGQCDATRLTADVMNKIGVMVVCGNIRRSAELSLGRPDDETFMNLKNYEKHPDRQNYGWMSNNTVVLSKSEDFNYLPQIAERIRKNGEPGIFNLINAQKYGRYGKPMHDDAFLLNPCAEITLENFELCNLAEVFPTRCESDDVLYQANKYATYYASTVALLPSHRSDTNAVIARNRRIGVSWSGIADYIDIIGATELTNRFRRAYDIIKAENIRLAQEAGVPQSIRVTTVKPSGTISLLAGVSAGIHYPTFKYAIRRMRVAIDSPIFKLLDEAGVPNEKDVYSDNTQVFEFPIDQGGTREATEVSAWEQLALLACVQREYADNAVSCTVYFSKSEEHQIEKMLGQFAPLVKSVSMLPHSDEGAYEQMPYERIDKDEYNRRVKAIGKFDWAKFTGSDGKESRFCTSDNCEI